MKKPYVGVSGIVSRDQADVIYNTAEQFMPRRRLLLGVKAVHKTQWCDIENKYGPEWYPVGRNIREVADEYKQPGEFWVVQNYLDIEEADERSIKDYERRFVRNIIARTGIWADGMQFDLLPWHKHDYRQLFADIKQQDLEVLVECQGPIMTEYSATQVGEVLDRYEGLIDHVLFDASHGTGKEMDTDALRPFIEQATERDWLGVGVAGGLNPERVSQHIEPLLEEFPDLSFDAEGQLHVNDDGSRGLNINQTRAYLKAAAEALSPRD